MNRELYYFRLISRAPGLKVVVETLIQSLAPIGNLCIVGLVFFVIFGILGVQVSQLLLSQDSICEDWWFILIWNRLICFWWLRSVILKQYCPFLSNCLVIQLWFWLYDSSPYIMKHFLFTIWLHKTYLDYFAKVLHDLRNGLFPLKWASGHKSKIKNIICALRTF